MQSSALHSLLVATLYSDVDLKSSAHCLTILPFLLANPELARRVQHLAVRPNSVYWITPDKTISESWVSNHVVQLVPMMPELRSFTWDGCDAASTGTKKRSRSAKAADADAEGIAGGLFVVAGPEPAPALGLEVAWLGGVREEVDVEVACWAAVSQAWSGMTKPWSAGWEEARKLCRE